MHVVASMSGGGDWELSSVQSTTSVPGNLIQRRHVSHEHTFEHEQARTAWKATSGLPSLFCIPAITAYGSSSEVNVLAIGFLTLWWDQVPEPVAM